MYLPLAIAASLWTGLLYFMAKPWLDQESTNRKDSQ